MKYSSKIFSPPPRNFFHGRPPGDFVHESETFVRVRIRREMAAQTRRQCRVRTKRSDDPSRVFPFSQQFLALLRGASIKGFVATRPGCAPWYSPPDGERSGHRTAFGRPPPGEVRGFPSRFLVFPRPLWGSIFFRPGKKNLLALISASGPVATIRVPIRRSPMRRSVSSASSRIVLVF